MIRTLLDFALCVLAALVFCGLAGAGILFWSMADCIRRHRRDD